MRVVLVGMSLVPVSVSVIMRLLVVEKPVHGRLLLLLLKTASVHLRMAAGVKTAASVLPVYVHVHPEHRWLVQRPKARLHCTGWRAARVKTGVFIMGTHV